MRVGITLGFNSDLGTYGRCIIGERELPGRSYNLGDKNAMNPHTCDTVSLDKHTREQDLNPSPASCCAQDESSFRVWSTLQFKVLVRHRGKGLLANWQLPNSHPEACTHSKALDSNRQVTRGLIAQLFQW